MAKQKLQIEITGDARETSHYSLSERFPYDNMCVSRMGNKCLNATLSKCYRNAILEEKYSP